jgi:hypothetical protein
MPLVILHHLLNVFVQLANKRGVKQKKNSLYLNIRNPCFWLCGRPILMLHKQETIID